MDGSNSGSVTGTSSSTTAMDIEKRKEASLPHSAIHLFTKAAAESDIKGLEKYYQDHGSAIANAMNTNGDTALSVALSSEDGYDNLDVVQYLVQECGAGLDSVDKDGRPALYVACKFDRLEAVQYFVETCHVNVEACSPTSGWTALNVAAFYGYLEIVRFLLEHGKADAKTVCGRDERTALHSACERDHMHVVKYLIEVAGVNVKAANGFGETPLHVAVRMGHIKMVQYLTDSICHRVDGFVDAVNWYGQTALHYACKYGLNPMLVECLVDQGRADLDVVDKEGRTALYIACGDNVKKVEYLLEKGADVNIRASSMYFGRTVLHMVARFGFYGEKDHQRLIRRLVEEFQADIAAVDDMGWTALHHASQQGNVQSAIYLYEAAVAAAAADTDRVGHIGTTMSEAASRMDVEGRSTPLHLACTNSNCFRLVLFFVERIPIDS